MPSELNAEELAHQLALDIETLRAKLGGIEAKRMNRARLERVLAAAEAHLATLRAEGRQRESIRWHNGKPQARDNFGSWYDCNLTPAHVTLRAPKDELAAAKAELTPDELVRLSAIERLFEWAREHEEAAMPMPVFHRYMSKVDGGECPQWRIQLGVKVAAFSDPWSAVCAAADAADALALTRATGGDRG